MLLSINKHLEKWMPLITPVSVVIGVLLTTLLIPYTYLVPWLFAILTFFGSLKLNFRDLKQVLTNPLPIILCLLLLHVIMPLIGWGTGLLFFKEHILLITGLVVLMLTPTGVFSLMWVSIYNGNIALTLSIIIISTLLAPFLIPFCLYILVGSEIAIDKFSMMKGLLLMIVVPSFLGLILNYITKGEVQKKWSPSLAPFSKIGLSLVIMINSAAIAPFLLDFNMTLIYLSIIIVILVSIGYIAGWLVSKWLHYSREVTIALTLNSGMRNISAGAVIAIAYFPHEVVFPVIVGMLIQQSLASLFGKILFSEKKAVLAGGTFESK